MRCVQFCFNNHKHLKLLMTMISDIQLSPDPAYRVYAEQLLSVTYLRQKDVDDGLTDSDRRQRATALVSIFNSDWRDWTLAGFKHHRQLGDGFASDSEIKVRAFAAIMDVVFSRRPTIPSVSRWTKCTQTSRWFVCTIL
jgi:hypothetical protein